MLALTRKINEEIIIQLADGKKIVINVSEVKGNKVKLSFDADKEIKIYRKELLA